MFWPKPSPECALLLAYLRQVNTCNYLSSACAGRCVKEFKSDGSSSVVMDLEALSPVGGCDRPVNVSPEVKIGCVAAAWNRLCISVTESVVMESTATQPSHRLVIVDGTHSADPGKRRVSALPLSDTFTSLACCDHTTVAVDGMHVSGASLV